MIDLNKKQPIIEAYICIQTEGSQAGRPHFLVRTTGCTHRCWFGEGGWCDSWYSSITPEKGKFNLQQIKDLFESRKDITHLMISGGSPTMHEELVDDLVSMFKELHADGHQNMWNRKLLPSNPQYTNGFVTIETEGSHFIKTKWKIDLISLSPKFTNSIPKLGVQLPNSEKVTDQKMIDLHEKFRMNIEAMKKMIAYHLDFHFKPVVDRNDLTIWDEIENFRREMRITKTKTWVMPAGDTRESVIPNYTYCMEQCAERGYNFTGRAHIIAFDDKRGV